MNVENPSVSAYRLFNIRRLTLERSLMSAVSVGISSGLTFASSHIRESTPGRILTGVMSVWKPSVTRDTLFSISKFSLDRSPMSVTSVGKPSARVVVSFTIRGHTVARSPISAVSVTKTSVCSPPWCSIRGFTLERGPMSVTSMGRPLER